LYTFGIGCAESWLAAVPAATMVDNNAAMINARRLCEAVQALLSSDKFHAKDSTGAPPGKPQRITTNAVRESCKGSSQSVQAP
jgi:hypothetical protein